MASDFRKTDDDSHRNAQGGTRGQRAGEKKVERIDHRQTGIDRKHNRRSEIATVMVQDRESQQYATGDKGKKRNNGRFVQINGRSIE